ncbi:hypothetical protein FCV25MIE_32602 [Fagus crenata]
MSTASSIQISHGVNPRDSKAIQIQLKLEIGPTGQWEISQARVVNSVVEAQAKPLNPIKTPGPNSRPTSSLGQRVTQPTQVWQARSSSAQPSRASSQPSQASQSPTPESPILKKTPKDPSDKKAPEDLLKALTFATLRRLGSDTSHEVQIAGDATKWLLRLCDGRSLLLPVVCPCGSSVLRGEDDEAQAMVVAVGVSSPTRSEQWCDDDNIVDSMFEDLGISARVEGDIIHGSADCRLLPIGWGEGGQEGSR